MKSVANMDWHDINYVLLTVRIFCLFGWWIWLVIWSHSLIVSIRWLTLLFLIKMHVLRLLIIVLLINVSYFFIITTLVGLILISILFTLLLMLVLSRLCLIVLLRAVIDIIIPIYGVILIIVTWICLRMSWGLNIIGIGLCSVSIPYHAV